MNEKKRYLGKDFLIIESDHPIDAHITGIVNDSTVHIHLLGTRITYYEGTKDRLEINLRIKNQSSELGEKDG